MQKDFEKFVYFTSKSRNFAIVYKPDKKKTVDGETVFEPGIRFEFNNGMLAMEKTKENEVFIEFLRDRAEKEKLMDQKRRQFWEEDRPKIMIEEEKVKQVLAEKLSVIEQKDRKIKELEEQIKKSK